MTPDPIMARLEAAMALMLKHAPRPNPPLDTAGSPAVARIPSRNAVSGDLYSTDAGDSSDPASVFSTREDNA